MHTIATVCLALSSLAAPLDDDVSPSAGNYGLDLRLLGRRHSELVERLLEIVEKSIPLRRRDHKVLVRVPHGGIASRSRTIARGRQAFVPTTSTGRTSKNWP